MREYKLLLLRFGKYEVGLRSGGEALQHSENSKQTTNAEPATYRPLTVLLLDSAAVPASARSGTLSLQQAVAYKPLQVIQNIQTPDAQEYDFQLQLANGQAFEVFAFYADSGMGKAMSLTRTVTTPLPTATNCLANVQTTYVYSHTLSHMCPI
ncbi:hypothetical protein EMMF5_000884 [Cystobasidiomycetes sp. EMM_F5]